MHTYREVRSLSGPEAAYLAGLIDGEGTVTLSRKHASDMRQLVVSIGNTELPMLEFALLSIGAGKLTHKATSKANHSPSGDFLKTPCWRCEQERRSPFSPAAEGAHWWRRRDSRFRLFRDGLDYAFIPQSLAQLRERGVLSGSMSPDPSDGSRRVTSAGL